MRPARAKSSASVSKVKIDKILSLGTIPVQVQQFHF